MGQEIVYCSRCQTQLRTADFEKGVGVHLEGQAYCKKCARDAVSSLPAEKQAQLLKQVEASKDPEKRLERDLPPGSTTDRIPKVNSARPPTRRLLSRDSGSRSLLGVVAVIVPAAIGIVIVIEMSGGGPARALPEQVSRPSTSVMTKPILPPGDKPKTRLDQLRDPTIPALSLEKREGIAKESLRQARDYAAANPSDFTGQHSRFEEAAWEARETSLQETARVELKAVEKREIESFSPELSALDSKTRQAQESEEFAKTLTLLEEAKGRHPGTGWAGEVERRVAQINEVMTKRYASVKEEALEAQKRGAQAEVKMLRERLKKWDMPALATELENSLADLAKPPETPKAVLPERP
ncbi:MAG TPA: hypothetical protein VG457_00985, partial [Planctomycetota bacterium]|nr:hypothetical protein [Planctomycetota bacterium]